MLRSEGSVYANQAVEPTTFETKFFLYNEFFRLNEYGGIFE
jgi:hypothetical protein